MGPSNCPDARNWQALLAEGDGGAPDDLAGHLETCEACQQTLELLAAEPAAWDDVAAALGGPAAREPALTRLLDQLKAEASAAPGDQEPALQHLLERLRRAEPAAAGGDDEPWFLAPAAGPGQLGVLGKYEIHTVLGRGGMGVVFQGFDPALRRPVAIKVLAPQLAGGARARQRFVREGQAAAAVAHDHVVPVYEVGEADGLPFLVMPYIAGESVQARLDRAGPLAVAEAVRIGWQTAAGLAAAHAWGLVHRDIKPANLLLEEGTGRVKITDFGLARTADDRGLTQDGVVAGTPEYMAPEQARGEPVDHRADLFSLGSVLYALVTGAPPFRGPSAVAVLRLVSDAAPVPVRALNPAAPAWLEGLINRLLAKDPAERYQTAAEVADLLAGALDHLGRPELVPPPEVRVPRPADPARVGGGGRRGLVGLVLAAGLVAGGLLLLQFARPPEPAPAPELYADFRGGAAPLPPLALVGSDAAAVTRPEEGGFRIILPPRRKQTDAVGLTLSGPVRGDFEITVRYQILHADRPVDGHGVGFELYAQTDTPTRDGAGVARVRRVNEGDVYTCSYVTTRDGQRAYRLQFPEASALSGRLRLRRAGGEVTLSAAEGDAAKFQELAQFPLGPGDVKFFRLAAYPGHAQNAVDVRIQDVRLRAGSLDEVAAPAATSPDPAPAPRPGPRWKAWLTAGTLLGLGLTYVLALWRSRRRVGPRAEAPPRAAETGPAGTEVLPPTVKFPCASCGQDVRARADLVGKSVKCPRCARAVRVPSGSAGGPPSVGGTER